MEEKELLERARAGERRAMGELYETHARRVYTVVRRLVGDDHLAEDLAQEDVPDRTDDHDHHRPEPRPQKALFLIKQIRRHVPPLVA